MKTVGISSFKVAAFALCKGHRIQSTTRSGRRVSFFFENNRSFSDDLDAYKYSNPSVPVHDLESSMTRLKELIFNEPREGVQC